MDLLRAHHDGQLIGANTLREEPGIQCVSLRCSGCSGVTA